MHADSVAYDNEYPLRQALALHKRYFETVDGVVSTLMAPDEPDAVGDALSILGDACRCSFAGVYLNEPECGQARLFSHWIDPLRELPADALSDFLCVPYSRFTQLAETLEIGMVLNKSLLELSQPVQMRFAPLGVRRLIFLPLLDRGFPFGFLALADLHVDVVRGQAELHCLAVLANVFAQALLKQRAEAEMRTNQQRLLALVGATQDTVFELNENGVIVQVWSGHPALPPADGLVGKSLSALPAGMADELAQALPQVVNEARSVQINCTLYHGGAPVYLLVRLSPIQSGDRLHAVAMAQDVSEIMRDATQRKTMLDTLNLLEEAIVDLTPTGELVQTTPAWARLRAIDPKCIDQDLGSALWHWAHPDDRDTLMGALTQLLESADPNTPRFRLLRGDAEPIWVEARLIAHHAPDGSIQGVRGVLRDVTVAHLNQQHITQLALYDSLTHLPNRLLLDEQLHQAIARARRNHTRVALGFIDLDHFKEVNDAFGHKVGDELLISVADKLAGVLRENDMLARWGGDEFIALIPDLPETACPLRELAERLRSAAQQGVMLDGLENIKTHPTISVGFAVYPDDASSAEDLLSAADHTMYHAKNNGRNKVAFCSDSAHLKALGREQLLLKTRLSGAIQDNGLQVFFQPIVEGCSGAVLGLEALARWPDGQGGWVSPDIFIPLAEKTGLIQELSSSIIGQGLAQLAQWRAAGLHQPLMVNISRSQLFAPNFVTMLTEQLRRFKLQPQDLILEITESVALTDYARQLRHLRQLVTAGFRIAIDDFGTGYSSLSQLHEIPAQLLKIDASFSRRLNTEEGRSVMQAIIQLGHLLKLDVVAEGVESEEIARHLQQLGVRRMQGFYFSEAVSAGAAELMLRLGVTRQLNPA